MRRYSVTKKVTLSSAGEIVSFKGNGTVLARFLNIYIGEVDDPLPSALDIDLSFVRNVGGTVASGTAGTAQKADAGDAVSQQTINWSSSGVTGGTNYVLSNLGFYLFQGLTIPIPTQPLISGTDIMRLSLNADPSATVDVNITIEWEEMGS